MPKALIWIGDSRRRLQAFPEPVKDEIGYALWQAQEGTKAKSAKPMSGFSGAGVLEIVEDFDGDTFRAVYTVRLKSAVYVLHCFQKKSKHGIATPRPDLKLIERRLRDAVAIEAELEKPE